LLNLYFQRFVILQYLTSQVCVKACPHQATKLPKTATICCRKRQQIVAVSGNNLLQISATLLPGADRPLGC